MLLQPKLQLKCRIKQVWSKQIATIEYLDAMLIAENIDDTVKFYCDKIGFELGFIIRDEMIPFA